jgi:hypothetical protein
VAPETESATEGQDFLEWARAADQLESIPEHEFIQLTNQGANFVTRVDSESLGESVAAFAYDLGHPSPRNPWTRLAALDPTRLPYPRSFRSRSAAASSVSFRLQKANRTCCAPSRESR